MYNLTEYSNNYSKTSESLWKYYRDESALDNNVAIIDFPADNDNSALFKLKIKIAGRTDNYATKDVKIMVPLKFLNNFWRKCEIALINCGINLILTRSANCFSIDNPDENQIPTSEWTDTKRYVLVVTLPTQDNENFNSNWNQVLKEQLTGIKVQR